MRIVIFGLSVSSAWGNGHAALWRALIGGLVGRGCSVVFYERDQNFYAEHRDLDALPDGASLRLYEHWPPGDAATDVRGADVAIVTSFCPDGAAAARLLTVTGHALRCFYDLDSPVTLARAAAGLHDPAIGPAGLGDYDLVLSFTGGAALDALRDRFGARRVAPLYGSVDPAVHAPVPPEPGLACDLSYLGTFADDRQEALERLFVRPAERAPAMRFFMGGAQYPQDFPWQPNIWFARHVPPPCHAAFYCSSRATLNVTRAPMARMGWCPSGRLFEAAACGVPVISDTWDGIEAFFRPGDEIILARDTEDVLAALSLTDAELRGVGARARERALAEHTADTRAAQMLDQFARVGRAAVAA